MLPSVVLSNPLCNFLRFENRPPSSGDPSVTNNEIILRKHFTSNHIQVRTNAGNRFVSTIASPSTGEYKSLECYGLTLKKADDSTVLSVDNVNGDASITSNVTATDIELNGVLNATDSKVFMIDDNMIQLNEGSVTDNSHGWYAPYNNGGNVRYRGCIFDSTDEYFKFFENSTDEPDEKTAIVANSEVEAKKMYCLDTSNQVRLGMTHKATLNFVMPAGGTSTYTIPDTGVNSYFLMTELNIQTLGVKTMADVVAEGPIYGLLYDYQSFSFAQFANPTNLNQADGPFFQTRSSTSTSGIPTVSSHVRFVNNDLNITEYGYIQVRLRAGTYVAWFAYRMQNNHGTYELYCTALGYSYPFDAYFNGVTIGGSSVLGPNIVVPDAGIYNFAFRKTGKNASATGRILDIYPDLYFMQIA